MENVFMLSAFHGLHCLKSIHKAFGRLQANNATTESTTMGHINHASHCFDYLRQSIICAGDMTIEGPDLTAKPGESPLRGWGVEHQCRPWRKVLEWRDSHAAW